MKAISIRQPWAWLIVNGYKDIENRTWKHDFTGTALVHAGKKIDTDAIDYIRETFPDIPLPERFDLGGIVGLVDITGYTAKSDSRWFQGPFGFLLQNGRTVPFNPCNGALGFFRPAFDWRTAWTYLRMIDGASWDAENERLETLWKAEYHTAFVAHAVSRGWTQENAEVWCGEIVDAALWQSSTDKIGPVDVAQQDVIACERETQNA